MSNRIILLVLILILLACKNKKLLLNAFAFVHTKEGYYLYTPYIKNENQDNYMLQLVSENMDKVKRKYISDNTNHIVKYHEGNFYKNRDNLYFHYGYNDTIYKIDNENIIPFLHVDFGNRKLNLEGANTLNKFQKTVYDNDPPSIGNIANICANEHKILYTFGEIKLGSSVTQYSGSFDTRNNRSVFYRACATEFPFSWNAHPLDLTNEYSIHSIYPNRLSAKGEAYFRDKFNINFMNQSNPMLLKVNNNKKQKKLH